MGRFWIRETAAGFCFDLRAANGSVVASGGPYRSRGACRRGIASVRRCCTAHLEDQTERDWDVEKHPKLELFRDEDRRFYFCLRARNGAVIASSGSYRTKASCLDGIASMRRSALAADVWEE